MAMILAYMMLITIALTCAVLAMLGYALWLYDSNERRVIGGALCVTCSCVCVASLISIWLI